MFKIYTSKVEGLTEFNAECEEILEDEKYSLIYREDVLKNSETENWPKKIKRVPAYIDNTDYISYGTAACLRSINFVLKSQNRSKMGQGLSCKYENTGKSDNNKKGIDKEELKKLESMNAMFAQQIGEIEEPKEKPKATFFDPSQSSLNADYRPTPRMVSKKGRNKLSIKK
jgi:hypothetical protein